MREKRVKEGGKREKKVKIRNLKTNKNFKNNDKKNASRNVSGAVVGSVGSVQCQTCPCSSWYLFSSLRLPLKCAITA